MSNPEGTSEGWEIHAADRGDGGSEWIKSLIAADGDHGDGGSAEILPGGGKGK